MARSYICGFEMGSVGEALVLVGAGPSIQSTVKRSGTYSMRITTGGTGLRWGSLAAGGTARNFALSIRFYLRIDTLPAADAIIWDTTTGSDGNGRAGFFQLNTNGAVRVGIIGGSTIVSSLTLSADSQWHLIEVDGGWNSGAGIRVNVDGVEWASLSTTAFTAKPYFSFGSDSNCDIYIDDVIVDDASFATSGFPGAGNVICLIPTAGNNANSWVGGAGGTGNISVGVDNIPPTGDATPADADQIKNAASGGNLDYTATMQSYTVGGVPAGATVNAIMAICNDAEEVGTNTKAGGIWCASNPAQGAGGNSFDFGDDVGAFGTFPSKWATHCGPVAVAPSVTLGTAPTVTVRKTSSTTRVVDVDFMGLYVDYTPAVATKIPPPFIVSQAVKRSSIY